MGPNPPLNLNFDPEVFASVIGGRPTIDTPCLSLDSVDAARAYIAAYGYDVTHPADQDKLWSIHDRAIRYLKTQLLEPGERLADAVTQPKCLEDVLIAASDRQSTNHRDACACLRVMHVVAQLENDLFAHFCHEIQDEILKPYRRHVAGTTLAHGRDDESITLEAFEIKPFKNSDSSITKLLAKPDEVAFGLLDKIGVRFVTRGVFDVFRVMRFLVKNHVVSPANIIPNQSNNTLYPVDLFAEVVAQMTDSSPNAADIDRALAERLVRAGASARYLEKKNGFTAAEYRFVKFITRQLVRVRHAGTQESFGFFYPYEVQIIDADHYLGARAGPGSHDQYKARQRARARARVFS